mgnify:CR=1 FL=1
MPTPQPAIFRENTPHHYYLEFHLRPRWQPGELRRLLGQALAARALALHEQPEVARRMGAAARRVAEEELSLEVCGRRFVEAWRDLARAGPRMLRGGRR